MSITQNDETKRLSMIINEHLHSEQEVAPNGAASIAIASNVAAWTFGAFTADIIAAGAVAYKFDIHHIFIASVSQNATYEIQLYYGAADTSACWVRFTRDAPFTSSIDLPTITHLIPAGSRIRAKMKDSAGGGTAIISIYYHAYDIPGI
jgi:hypothetical protein